MYNVTEDDFNINMQCMKQNIVVSVVNVDNYIVGMLNWSHSS